MNTSDHINEIAAALAKAQGAMKPAVKDASNPAFKQGNKVSKYADLAANVEAAREPMAANGLAVVQEATTVERGVAVSTRIVHSSGQWIHFDPITIPLGKQDAHGVGSATTYARRYALGAALGLVAEDDDGNAAAEQGPEKREQAQPKAPAGFDNWLANMEATADEGVGALESAWRASSATFRSYLQATDNAKWEKAKARARQATEKSQEPAHA